MSEYFYVGCERHRVRAQMVAARGFFEWRADFPVYTDMIGDFIDKHSDKACKLVVVSEHADYEPEGH